MIRFWCDTANWAAAARELRVHIAQSLEEAGIEIPFPQRELRIRSMPDGALGRLAGKDRL